MDKKRRAKAIKALENDWRFVFSGAAFGYFWDHYSECLQSQGYSELKKIYSDTSMRWVQDLGQKTAELEDFLKELSPREFSEDEREDLETVGFHATGRNFKHMQSLMIEELQRLRPEIDWVRSINEQDFIWRYKFFRSLDAFLEALYQYELGKIKDQAMTMLIDQFLRIGESRAYKEVGYKWGDRKKAPSGSVGRPKGAIRDYAQAIVDIISTDSKSALNYFKVTDDLRQTIKPEFWDTVSKRARETGRWATGGGASAQRLVTKYMQEDAEIDAQTPYQIEVVFRWAGKFIERNNN